MTNTAWSREWKYWYIVEHLVDTKGGDVKVRHSDLLANSDEQALDIANANLELKYGIERITRQGTAEDYERYLDIAGEDTQWELGDVVELVNKPD